MRYDDDRLERLELLVEQLTKRVAHLEQGAPDAPAPPAEPAPPPSRIAAPPRPREPREPREPAAPPPAPRPTAPRRPPGPSIDLEDLLGGRVLAWAGALAVVVGIVFFLATAIRRGWIDEPTRVVLAYLGSTLLLAAGLYLYERKGQTQAAIAAVAAAVFGLFASTVAATLYVTKGRPAVTHVRQASFWARASKASTSSTSIPSARSRSSPPPDFSPGSGDPATTLLSPLASTASTQGGVRP